MRSVQTSCVNTRQKQSEAGFSPRWSMPWTSHLIPSKKISPSPCAGEGDVGDSWPRESYVSLHGYEGVSGLITQRGQPALREWELPILRDRTIWVQPASNAGHRYYEYKSRGLSL